MRTITSTEFEFLKSIEALCGINLQALGLSDKSLVEPMDDGGMGSIYFPIENRTQLSRRFGQQIVEGISSDLDGTPVNFTINLDEDGLLFELDMWRIDFEPLQHFPTICDEIRIIPKVD